VKVDVSPQQQFANTSPIVRRVDNGEYSIIAAYDPTWEQFPAGRMITLNNFDGQPGLTVQIRAEGRPGSISCASLEPRDRRRPMSTPVLVSLRTVCSQPPSAGLAST